MAQMLNLPKTVVHDIVTEYLPLCKLVPDAPETAHDQSKVEENGSIPRNLGCYSQNRLRGNVFPSLTTVLTYFLFNIFLHEAFNKFYDFFFQ